MDIEESYVYPSLKITEHLDHCSMAKHVSRVARRALGLVIAKYKVFGGLPFNNYSNLYESLVNSTVN